MEDLMEKVISLCKRRGFVYPGSEIYGGLANTWDFGPLGLALKKNIKNLWWQEFVEKEENIYGLDGGIILSPKVWEASGHVENFTDSLVECKSCHKRFRADQIENLKKCAECGGVLTEPKNFNGMFQTQNGLYLRPETAQAIFVNFKNIVDSFRPKLPFGIAQIGKAFRNEITAGNFIFRDLEFEQMELEYFVSETDWGKYFDHYLKKLHSFADLLGVTKISEREHELKELSHYSKKTVDLEYNYPFGKKELWGLAYRTDYDLKIHNIVYEDFFPHVIEPSLGVERTMLAVLCSVYFEGEKRVVLKLKPSLAPYKAAVFPLVANKEELVKKAREIYVNLKQNFPVAWDERGNIGKRYYAQDEIGTPWCLTIDYQTLEDDTVTVRDRDTARQERINVAKLEAWLKNSLLA